MFIVALPITIFSALTYPAISLSNNTDVLELHETVSRVAALARLSLSVSDGGPYPPDDFTVTPGPTYVDLSWRPSATQSSSIIGFYIYRNNYFNDEAPPDISVGADTTHYRDYNVTPGTRYWYSIRSVDSNGPGYWAHGSWVVPGETVPSEPIYLTALAKENAVSISWEWPNNQGGTPVIGYRIYRGLSSDNKSFIGKIESQGVSVSYTDTGLVNGKVYHYAVAAYNSLGEGPVSDSAHAKPDWAPRNVTVDPPWVDHCGPVTINLTWQHSAHNYSRIVHYEIHGPAGVAEVNRQNTSFATTVSGGWGYAFQVVAVYDDGNKVYSDGVGIMAPMCEGVDCSICPFLLILGIVLAVFIVSIIIVMTGRRRR